MRVDPVPIPFPHPAGKGRMAKLIVSLLPEEHDTFVEPFGGGAAVLLTKAPSKHEVWNDLDTELYFAFQFIKSKLNKNAILSLKKRRWQFSREVFYEFRDAYKPKSELDRFYRFCVLSWFSYSGDRRTYSTTRSKRAGETSSAMLERLELVKERLKHVKLENRDAYEVMCEYDSAGTLYFLDPPYGDKYKSSWYHGERREEMKEEKRFDVEKFSDTVKSLKGKWFITFSGDEAILNQFAKFQRRRYRVKTAQTQGAERHANARERDEFFIANFDLPESLEGVDSKRYAVIKVEDELTREEQRRQLERKLGDWYLVKQPPDKTFPFVVQYHIRGIWDSDKVKEVAKAFEDADHEERVKLFKKYGCVYLLKPREEISKALQKVDDARGDVTSALKRFVSKEPPKEGFRRENVVNVGNCHVDFRAFEPKGEFLIGWTNDVVKIVFQNLDDELYFPLRDRFLENQEGDQWLAQKKAPQPLAWYYLVDEKKPVYEAKPGSVGATIKTAGRFLFRARGKLVYGVRKSDYHEQFLFFDDKKYYRINGRWEYKLIQAGRQYPKAPSQFWMGDRPWRSQEPYITTHDFDEEKKKAKREGVEIVWNDEALDVLANLGYKVSKSENGLYCRIWKVVPHKRVVIGPLLIPDKVDLQGDLVRAEDIEEVAHKFLLRGNFQIKFMHKQPLRKADAAIVESGIYRRYPMPEGTWIGAVKVFNDSLWQKILKGEITGFSVGGRGVREPLES